MRDALEEDVLLDRWPSRRLKTMRCARANALLALVMAVLNAVRRTRCSSMVADGFISRAS